MSKSYFDWILFQDISLFLSSFFSLYHHPDTALCGQLGIEYKKKSWLLVHNDRH